MTDIWDDERPDNCGVIGAQGLSAGYEVSKMDAWLEKLKAHYSPYDKLLKADHLMPLDIKRVLEKGMPVLIDEGRYNELKEKAERWDQYAIYDNDNEPKILVKDLITTYEKLEAVKKLVEQDLAQITMTHYFRRRFYELTNFPVPDWFKKAMEAET